MVWFFQVFGLKAEACRTSRQARIKTFTAFSFYTALKSLQSSGFGLST